MNNTTLRLIQERIISNQNSIDSWKSSKEDHENNIKRFQVHIDKLEQENSELREYLEN